MGSSRILDLMEEGEPRRRSLRRSVMLNARLSTSSGSYPVRIRDVSATGARIDGAELPAPGLSVLLTRGSFRAYGELRWVEDGIGGVEFEEPLDEDRMIEALNGLRPASATAAADRRPGLGRREHPRFSNGSGWLDLPAPRR